MHARLGRSARAIQTERARGQAAIALEYVRHMRPWYAVQYERSELADLLARLDAGEMRIVAAENKNTIRVRTRAQQEFVHRAIIWRVHVDDFAAWQQRRRTRDAHL